MQTSRGFEYGVIHFLAPEPGILSEVISRHLNINHADQLMLLEFGAIYLANTRLTPKSMQSHEELLQIEIQHNDYLRVHTKPRRFPQFEMKKRIVYQDEHMLVVDKPAMLPVHASVDNLKENLLAYLEAELQQKLYITHRLDTATRGLLVVAKTTAYQTAFNFLIKNHGIQKIYQAVVPEPGPGKLFLEHFMEPSPRSPKTVRSHPFVGGLLCQLKIQEIQPSQHQGFVRLTVQLLTGRTHQIRAQLCAEGFPIRGDKTYGGLPVYFGDQIDLFASELSYVDPITLKEHHFHLTKFIE